MIASVCVHVCAGNKTFKTCCCEKSCSRLEGTSLDTKQEVFFGGGAGGRGKRDAHSFSINARTSMRHYPAVTLSNKVPTFCTSIYLSIPALRASSSLSPGGGGRSGCLFLLQHFHFEGYDHVECI